MKLDLTNLTSIQIINLYNSLMQEKRQYEQDIEDSKRAMEDRYIYYQDKKELEADVLYDNQQIAIIEDKIQQIVEHAKLKSINLEPSEEKQKQLNKKMS